MTIRCYASFGRSSFGGLSTLSMGQIFLGDWKLKVLLAGHRKVKGQAQNDDDEPEDKDAGNSRQIKWQRRVTHSSEEDEEVEDERARVSLNSY